MHRNVEVLFTPADFVALRDRDLSGTTCVVFDVLRATSTMITALANGAEAILAVAEISDALAVRKENPSWLLAGERDGWRISAKLSGGVEFDFGNSPREFMTEKMRDRTIVCTTTNGTRALRACSHAGRVLICSFLNLSATTEWLEREGTDLLLVCRGPFEQAAYEDTVCAGALCDALWSRFGGISDSARMARELYLTAKGDLAGAMKHSRNAQRLLAKPELKDDVAFCLQCDIFHFAAGLKGNEF